MIAIARNDQNHLEEVDSANQLPSFPEFASFLMERYRDRGTVGDFEIFVRQQRH